MLSTWLRAIRIRFLLASVISVCIGLAINWWQTGIIDIPYAILTMLGVACLHASVDLLNDYWDYKRQIDTETKRTQFSGGTGVLPEGLLQPDQVYRVGLALLITGSIIGAFFIYERGITIAVILGFAIVSIYFYSTRIVDSGLGEVFVTIKGAMIVLGTYYVQSPHITLEPIMAGIVSGVLSATVLFVNSFPDYDADKSHGRKTLVIILGKTKASASAWVFPAITYGMITISTIISIFPTITLLTLITMPMAVKYVRVLKKKHEQIEDLVPTMSGFVTYSRITGAIFAATFVIDYLLKHIH